MGRVNWVKMFKVHQQKDCQISFLFLPEDKGFHEQRGITGGGRVTCLYACPAFAILYFVYPLPCTLWQKKCSETVFFYSL